MRWLLGLGMLLVVVEGCSPVSRDFNSSGGGASSSSGSDGGGGSGTGPANGGGGSGGTGNGGSGGSAPRHAFSPVAPSDAHFGWQSWQTAFLDADQKPCKGSISVIGSDAAVCFVAKGGSVRCTGTIALLDDGPQIFTLPGVDDAVQVFLSNDANSAGDSVCVLRQNGKIMCLGDDNDAGQFGTGDTTARSALTQFGSASNFVAMATGEWREICGLDSGGTVSCAGGRWPTTPMAIDTGYAAFWIDGNDAPQKPNNVYRVSAGRASCHVDDMGLSSPGGEPAGSPGHTVDGNEGQYDPPSGPTGGYDRTCTLTDDGNVVCVRVDQTGFPDSYEPFTGQSVLALGQAFGETLCAVIRDGSVICTGDNSRGQLGKNPSVTMYVEQPATIAPAGSVDTTCN